MIRKKYLLTIVFTLSCISYSFSQTVFYSLDSLLLYAEQNSYTIKTGEQQSLLAKYGKLAAIGSIPDIQGGVNFTATNNNKLPVNYFPAEIFGGPPGTYREVTMGQQYVNNLNGSIDVKLFKLTGWDELRRAKLNIRITASNNLLNKQSLFNDIAATYFNIVSLQEQIETSEHNISAADTLLTAVKNRFKEGLVSKKDVNDAEINLLNVNENRSQLNFQLQQQRNNLKILADLPLSDSVIINHSLNKGQLTAIQTEQYSDLSYKNAVLNEELAKIDVLKNKHALLPIASFFFSDNHLQSSNNFDLFNSSPAWVQSQYFGLKLSWNLPSSSTISQIYSSRTNYRIARLNTEHAKKQTETNNSQLTIAYKKALSQLITSEKVFMLSSESYQKSLNKFSEGLFAVDDLINTFNEMLTHRYNYTTALVSLSLAKAKIDINKRIQ
jgi:Outer membrane protein